MAGDLKSLVHPFSDWFSTMGWTPLPYQIETWQAVFDRKNGLVNAPTGSGKTYSLLLPAVMSIGESPQQSKGPRIIWVTPIRALTKEIRQAAEKAFIGLNLEWRVGIRTGDTSTRDRKEQLTKSPELLITTPESIHVLMATKGYSEYFSNLDFLIVDEWHELVGSKRGVQVQLALSRLKTLCPNLKIWGISATIGNMNQSLEILLGNTIHRDHSVIIKSKIEIDNIE